MLKVLIASVILIMLAVAGLAIKLLFDKKAEFSGGSCQSTNSLEELNARGISCGCDGHCGGSEQQ
ncbi:MAG: hypothetical protein K9J30_01485 [Bacteroidales bacterium]|nr:hypothetical protein [Bacteroidales bacterium]